MCRERIGRPRPRDPWRRWRRGTRTGPPYLDLMEQAIHKICGRGHRVCIIGYVTWCRNGPQRASIITGRSPRPIAESPSTAPARDPSVEPPSPAAADRDPTMDPPSSAGSRDPSPSPTPPPPPPPPPPSPLAKKQKKSSSSAWVSPPPPPRSKRME